MANQEFSLARSSDYLRSIQARLTKTPLVLLVEDDRNDADLLLNHLSHFDCHVDFCPDATCARRMAHEKKYDVILQDIKLPDFDGLDLLTELRGYSPNTEFIIVTGFPDSATSSRAVQSGAILVLPKPITRDTLALLFKAR